MDEDELTPATTVYCSTSTLNPDGNFYTPRDGELIDRQDAIEMFLNSEFELINSVSYVGPGGMPSIVDTFAHYEEQVTEATPRKKRRMKLIPDIKGIFQEELLSKRRVQGDAEE